MSKILRMDSPFMRGLGIISDLFILNIVTILFCIPIVTMGAAVTALNDAADRLSRDEGHAVTNFWQAFKSNFKQATVLWLILLAVGGLLLVSLLFYTTTAVAFGPIFKVISVALLVVWCVVTTWSFQLQCRFENGIKNTLRNALLCSLLYLPRTAVATLFNMAPWLVLYYYTVQFVQFTPVWIFIWFSMSAFVNAKVLAKPIVKLKEISEKQQDDQAVAEQ